MMSVDTTLAEKDSSRLLHCIGVATTNRHSVVLEPGGEQAVQQTPNCVVRRLRPRWQKSLVDELAESSRFCSSMQMPSCEGSGMSMSSMIATRDFRSGPCRARAKQRPQVPCPKFAESDPRRLLALNPRTPRSRSLQDIINALTSFHMCDCQKTHPQRCSHKVKLSPLLRSSDAVPSRRLCLASTSSRTASHILFISTLPLSGCWGRD